ncbi:hypothetical protein HMPREF0239_02276 [Clostridium sp. ATCC BAA-442]|nr:hypothetical protein HMPREF0239_02276 [Clostridium sp. ATCC BAA-442]
MFRFMFVSSSLVFRRFFNKKSAMNLPGGSVHGDKERRKPASLGRGGTGERQYRLQGMRAEGSTATKALGLNDSAPHR